MVLCSRAPESTCWLQIRALMIIKQASRRETTYYDMIDGFFTSDFHFSRFGSCLLKRLLPRRYMYSEIHHFRPFGLEVVTKKRINARKWQFILLTNMPARQLSLYKFYIWCFIFLKERYTLFWRCLCFCSLYPLKKECFRDVFATNMLFSIKYMLLTA